MIGRRFVVVMMVCAVGSTAACGVGGNADPRPGPTTSVTSTTQTPVASVRPVAADKLTALLDGLKPGTCVNFGFDGFSRNPKDPRLVGCSSKQAKQRFSRRAPVVPDGRGCTGKREVQYVGSDPDQFICLTPVFQVGNCMPAKKNGDSAIPGFDVPCDGSLTNDGDTKLRIVRVVRNANKKRYYCTGKQVQYDIPEQRIALCAVLLR